VGYPDDVKGYILIYPSTERLIIEHTIQFEESPLHAPPMKHAETLVLPSVPYIRYDDSTHSNGTYSDIDSKDYVHAYEQVVQQNEDLASELQQIPKWAQSTLQEIGNLTGDPLDSRRNRSYHVDPSHLLSNSKPIIPMHCYMVQYSDPHTYSEVVDNPLWEEAMHEEHDSLLKNQNWDLVPLPAGRKLVKCKWVYRTKRATDG
jgi:hypothetical protein